MMRSVINKFYSDFDYETVGPRKALSKDYRNPFQVDRDRIIYSSAFRRLQSKTQVFLSGEYDFYRTRLTHSLEVAQIAKSIVQYLYKTSPVLNDHFYIDLDLIEAAALTHDIGHPPFGHTGEKILQEIMEENRGGFEGNAQSLRIVSNLIYSSDSGRMGMAPTRAFLDGILKYKVLFSEKENNKKKYLLDDQDELLAFVYKCEKEKIPEFHKRSRSIECQIMEWADNSAYSINDLLDGFKAGFISKDKMVKWRLETRFKMDEKDKLKLAELENNLINEWQFEKFMARQIGKFIQEVSIVPAENFMSDLSNRYAYDLNVNPEMEKTYQLYKQIAIELIFNHPSVQQLEFKGKQIIRKIFEALENEYIHKKSPHIILPPLVHFQLTNEHANVNKYRIICDHIAGMSDAFVIKTYKRLFDPDFGSIVDLV